MTDIATNLNTIDGSLSDIKTAIVAKGVTPSGNITTYATAIGQISGGGGSGKYQLLERVKDDSNNEIGTVSGFFTDANNVEYAVVCLDAQYRLASGNWCSNTSDAVTNMPILSSWSSAWPECRDTATQNTSRILDFATSTGCSHCRSKSFTIGGNVYYGQLPNMREVFDIIAQKSRIENVDTSASSYTSLNFSSQRDMWSSSQFNYGLGWKVAGNFCSTGYTGKNTDYFIIPVLEIPNAV